MFLTLNSTEADWIAALSHTQWFTFSVSVMIFNGIWNVDSMEGAKSGHEMEELVQNKTGCKILSQPSGS